MTHSLVVLFDVFVFLGTVPLACILAVSIFSKSVQRSLGWYNLMASWLLMGSSYGLLLGRQEDPSSPPPSLCLIQALLVYASPVLGITATLCYYLEFHLIIISSIGIESIGMPNYWRLPLRLGLILIPWITWLAVILVVLLLNYSLFAEPPVLSVDGFYCNFHNSLPGIVSAGLVVLADAIMIILEVWTGYTMYTNRDLFRRLNKTDRRVLVNIYVRFILCTFCVIGSFVPSLITFIFSDSDVVAISILYPTAPIFFILAFGTQKDILRAFLFWRQETPEPYSSIVFHHHTVTTTSMLQSNFAMMGSSAASEPCLAHGNTIISTTDTGKADDQIQ